MNIAILDDDPSLAEFVSICLSSSGHVCKIFTNGTDFKEKVSQSSFDLYILDWELPDINGDIILKWLRDTYGFQTPVLFLTSHDSEQDIAKILQLGADDYVAKPIKPLELIARISALLRRSSLSSSKHNFININGIYFDLDAHSVTLDQITCSLTPKEYDLAVYMFHHIGHLITRNELLEKVWNTSTNMNTRTVDIHISRLRKKLLLDEEHGWNLQVIYQHGYRLELVNNHLLTTDSN
ncbi:MAG: response regulator transcription factor [Gammaproteobacteria bacterium]|nr:response regulator transcription factor [Gammaproteobacteria bacterium]MDH5735469.1 response regulator transcription factor [Gammaproteobacteria bacterium]